MVIAKIILTDYVRTYVHQSIVVLILSNNYFFLCVLFLDKKLLLRMVNIWAAITSTISVSALLLLRNMTEERASVRVAFLGNSIQYYNDLPRLMKALSNNAIEQDSCYRGNATLSSLFQDGNGMSMKFQTTNALRPDGTYDIGADTVTSLLQQQQQQPQNWDFVVMNDHTQHPTRSDTRFESVTTLVQDYAPLLRQSGAIPIFLMTYAYQERGAYGSDDLGDVVQFTKLLHEGYESYVQALAEVLPVASTPRIAPVGFAFLAIHEENPKMWSQLFHPDKKHPSPHGSFLIACVLYYTILGVTQGTEAIMIPDNGASAIWEIARPRVMQPADDDPLPIPTYDEAKYLSTLALRECLTYNYNKRKEITVQE